MYPSPGHKNLVLNVSKVQTAVKLHFALALAPPPDQPKITAFKKNKQETQIFITH